MDSSSISATFLSQYRASLGMLRLALVAYPPELWDNPAHGNRTWRLAYHVLHFTHLYLSPSEEEFVPWEHAIDEAYWLSARPYPPYDVVTVTGSNSVEQLIAYCDAIEASLDERLADQNYEGPSGVSWISFNRFELHVYNIRHLQHHVGQLIERLRAHTGIGVDWVGRYRAEATA